MPAPIPYPLIQGHRYSFASIEAVFNGLKILGFTSISYEDSLEPGKVYGSAPQKIGRTRGKADPKCEVEMLKLEWEQFKLTLGVGGVGFGETAFDIVVVYAELPYAPVTTDTIVGCRITNVKDASQDGTDPSKVTLTIDPMTILHNFVPMATPNGFGF